MSGLGGGAGAGGSASRLDLQSTGGPQDLHAGRAAGSLSAMRGAGSAPAGSNDLIRAGALAARWPEGAGCWSCALTRGQTCAMAAGMRRGGLAAPRWMRCAARGKRHANLTIII